MPRARAVVATRNQAKLRELGEILDSLELVPLPDEVELPPEEGETFADNALAKARAAHAATGMAAIADDSGIEARALGGRPGVRSARYAGPEASDEENLGLLLRELADAADRSVAYVCALAYVGEDGAERLFEGRCEGRLAGEPRGSGGFGYDPAFVPDDTGPGDRRTMAELSAAEKHAISHRGRAARSSRAGWRRGRDPHQVGRRDPLDRLQLAADRAQDRRRGDHRLDRDHHRGGALVDRPGRLGGRAGLGAKGGRAARPRAPLRSREGREPRRRDRGHADPDRRRDHRLRGHPPAGGRRRGREPRRGDRGDRRVGGRQPRRLRVHRASRPRAPLGRPRGRRRPPARRRAHLGRRAGRAGPGRGHRVRSPSTRSPPWWSRRRS